jgi:hypothetical protein
MSSYSKLLEEEIVIKCRLMKDQDDLDQVQRQLAAFGPPGSLVWAKNVIEDVFVKYDVGGLALTHVPRIPLIKAIKKAYELGYNDRRAGEDKLK